jgi:hypothetical protein
MPTKLLPQSFVSKLLPGVAIEEIQSPDAMKTGTILILWQALTTISGIDITNTHRCVVGWRHPQIMADYSIFTGLLFGVKNYGQSAFHTQFFCKATIIRLVT